LFARFDDLPLAAASIAQVHTAALHDGREVVVKIVRPDIRPQILQDFDILAWVAQWFEARVEAARAMHVVRVVDDYRQVILNELDLSLEADNTRQMRQNFLGSKMMYVPEVYTSTPDVMVAERITGVPVSDLATFERLGMDRAQLGEMGLTIFFTQVFRDNFFHADMHPGNVFVDTLDPANPRFIALDCAIMGELSDTDRLTVARMLLAVMQNNFTQLIQIVHQAGWIPPNTDQSALARDMRRAVGPMISKPMDQLDFAVILVQVMDIARRYHLEIPPQLMLLLKTLVHVEGLGRDLYPQLDIWKLARPILTEWVGQRMNPAKMLRDFGQQLPSLLMGASDLPAMITDSVHGLRQQAAWQDRQWRELQLLRMQMVQQRRRDWIAGGSLLIFLMIATQVVWPLAIAFNTIAILMVVWRVMS
jgi:ubiquinone biosynthesis protein